MHSCMRSLLIKNEGPFLSPKRRNPRKLFKDESNLRLKHCTNRGLLGNHQVRVWNEEQFWGVCGVVWHACFNFLLLDYHTVRPAPAICGRYSTYTHQALCFKSSRCASPSSGTSINVYSSIFVVNNNRIKS